MQNLWCNEEAAKYCQDELLGLRVYTSQLLGRNADLVLHGGGNTSVKASITNLFGDYRGRWLCTNQTRNAQEAVLTGIFV